MYEKFSQNFLYSIQPLLSWFANWFGLFSTIPPSHVKSKLTCLLSPYLPPAAASAALFCLNAWSSANRSPTRCVILIYRSAQFSTHVVSYLSSDFERKDDTHVWKHRSVNVLYILYVVVYCNWFANRNSVKWEYKTLHNEKCVIIYNTLDIKAITYYMLLLTIRCASITSRIYTHEVFWYYTIIYYDE